MTTRRKWLIFLANFIHIFHHVVLPSLLILICGPTITIRLLVYVVSATVAYVVPSQIIFKGPRGGDCAVSVFEFCLRGLGGEEFDLKRLHSMVVLADRGTSREKIYRRLLLKSGVFLFVAGFLVTTVVVLLEYFIA